MLMAFFAGSALFFSRAHIHTEGAAGAVFRRHLNGELEV